MFEDNRDNKFPRWDRLSVLEDGFDLNQLRDPGMYAVAVPANGPLATNGY